MTTNILILSIQKSWIHRLYSDYIDGIQIFIKKYLINIQCDIIFCPVDDIINNNVFNNIVFNAYTHVLYFGSFDVFNSVVKRKNINLYYVNIEQLSIKSYYRLLCTLDKNTNVIDYTEENIPYINNYFSSRVHLIPPYFDCGVINKTDKTIDVVTINNNNYRVIIINL